MKLRRRITIKGRSSSIANAFVHAVIPEIDQILDDHAEALEILGMSPTSVVCVYCGSATTDWDHFKPLVLGGRPTGFGHGVRNLVPACGLCNQSKGGREWRTWMLGQSPNSPRSRKTADVHQRVAALERFELWSEQTPTNFAMLVAPDLWERYWTRLEEIKVQLSQAQHDANIIRAEIVSALARKSYA